MRYGLKSFRLCLFSILSELIVDEKLLKSESSNLRSQLLWDYRWYFSEEGLILELFVLRESRSPLTNTVVDDFIFSDRLFCRFDHCFFDEGAT
jgi:hypothetical protein